MTVGTMAARAVATGVAFATVTAAAAAVATKRWWQQ
jgi:hypothetical protein